MSALLKLKARAASKRAEAQKILDAIANGAEHRDMSPEEKTRFDGLMAENASLKAQIASAKAIEADEDEDDVEEVAPPAERSVRRSKPPGEAPAIHAEKRPYSILRAMSLRADGKPLDGLEGEISREIARRCGREPDGFFMPLGLDPEIRTLMNRGVAPERRDLTTTTGAGSIFTVPELPFIDLLRAKLVIRELGARMINDVQGLFAIPRQTASATVYWIAEGNSASTGNPSLDQVAFSPKVALAATTISKKFMNQTSLDAEAFVKEDLAETMAREFDRVAINGSGGTQPLGILQNTTIQANSAGLAAAGGNGGVPTFAQLVGMESQVAGYNADSGKLSYLTSPSLRGVLKQTPKITSSTFPIYLYEDTATAGVGMMNGYPVRATTLVPSNLTKGTGTGLSAIIFGDWSSLVCATWEGVDVVVNPYTPQLSGAVTVSTSMSVDVNVRHPESFSIITDADL